MQYLCGSLLILGWTLALLPGAVLRGESLFLQDLTRFHRPIKTLLVQLWSSSDGLPLWNPYLGSGQPFAANPHYGVFHPSTSLFLTLPFEAAFALFVLLPVPISLAAMAFMLRTMGHSRATSFTLGCAWALGGYSLSLTNLPPIAWTAAPLPAVLAFGLRVYRHRRWLDGAALALCFAAQCTGGSPQTLAATAVLLAVALVVEQARRPTTASAGRSALVVGAGLFLGAALAAPVLLPGAHHMSKTVRPSPPAELDFDRWSMPVLRVAEPVLPRIAGHPHSQDWGRALYRRGEPGPLVLSIYPGLLVTILALHGALRRSVASWAWMGVAAFGGLLALGANGPLWRAVTSLVPLLAGMRFPEKWVIVPAVATVVLAAPGLDRVVHADRDTAWAVIRWLAACAAAVTGVAVVCFAAAAGSPGILRSFAVDGMVVAATALVAIGAVVTCLRWRSPLVWTVVALTLAIDLTIAGRPLVPTSEPARLKAVPRALLPIVPPPETRLFHLADWHPECRNLQGLAAPPMPVQWGIPLALDNDFDLTQLTWTHHAMRMAADVLRQDRSMFDPILDRLGVGAILTCESSSTQQQGQPRLQLHRRPDPPPGPFCVGRVVRIADDSHWTATAIALGDALSTTAIVADDAADDVPARPSPCTVTVVQRRPGRLVADVTSHGPGPSFVALDHTWDDGWELHVDATPTRLVRTDVSLSGFLVPAGTHRVELRYRDPWVGAGLFISLAAALILATTTAVATVRHRHAIHG